MKPEPKKFQSDLFRELNSPGLLDIDFDTPVFDPPPYFVEICCIGRYAKLWMIRFVVDADIIDINSHF